MRKTIFALVLALLCMLTAVPALAAGLLRLGGMDIISNPSGNIGGGTYAYDAATKTLTLTNVNLEGNSYVLWEDNSANGLDTIVLNGENTIETTDSYAILVHGDITFTGEGSLTAIAPFYPISVDYGDLIIDGADVAAQTSGPFSEAILVQGEWIENSYDTDGKIEIRNGGSLKSNGMNAAILCGNKGGISVTGGSRLVIDIQDIWRDYLYQGTLTVSDTSRVEIRSYYGGLPEQTVETAEAAVLTARDWTNYKYGLSFNKGSEPYIFTVTQTAMADERNMLSIIGEEESSSEGGSMPGGSSEGTATRAPMPETGDEAMPMLWSSMLLAAVVYFITRKRANA